MVQITKYYTLLHTPASLSSWWPCYSAHQKICTLLLGLHTPASLSTWWPCYSAHHKISTRSCQFCTPQPHFQPGDLATVHITKFLHAFASFAHPSLTFNLVTLPQCTSQNLYTLLLVLHIPALLSTWWPCYSSVYQIISTRSCQFCTPQPRFQPGDPVTVHVRKYLLPIPILTQPSLAFNPVTLSGCTSENLYTLLPFWHSPASPSTWWPCQGACQKISTPSCPFGTAQPCCQPGDLALRMVHCQHVRLYIFDLQEQLWVCNEHVMINTRPSSQLASVAKTGLFPFSWELAIIRE